MTLLLGYDVGSSSIKATLLEADTGKVLGSATSPAKEMDIMAPRPGWAEQHPETWWEHVRTATRDIAAQSGFNPADVRAVGISYQMHGLVVVDKNRRVLRPAIIWCDSRAVETGEKAASEIGTAGCLERLLNLPGNFTASKLKWVKDNEPDIYAQIDKIMLPGDYIALKMTGEIKTTPSGLSEGILWDYRNDDIAAFLLEHYGIAPDLLPETIPTFAAQGELTQAAAEELGLCKGTPVSYRAGDQPNNALSLNVLNPGEVAVTAGTSGVVYGVTEKAASDPLSRVNVFVHVNHTPAHPRYGVLLCLNGAGILNSWLKHNFTGPGGETHSYQQMDETAAQTPPGADGLIMLPYGNGAERTLENRDPGASIHHWNFNVHKRAHFLRAAQEGIVYALNYGLGIMHGMGMQVSTVRAGYANMFRSSLFTEAFATVTGAAVELYNTDGSQGAARGAGLGAGIYQKAEEAFAGLRPIRRVVPNPALASAYEDACARWMAVLEKHKLQG